MTKLTFDVDFSKDPEEILQAIQERAREEVAKRESKEKTHAYLTRLHEVVNTEIGTSYKSLGDLIRALSAYTKVGAGREKVAKTSPSGRRITVSMNQQIYDEIKSLLAQPNPNKAAIARKTGASVVQVRKVAVGGFDVKFGGRPTSPASPKVAAKLLPTKAPKKSKPDEFSQTEPPLTLPSLEPDHSEPSSTPVAPIQPTIAPPSFGEEIAEEPAPLATPHLPNLHLPPLDQESIEAPESEAVSTHPPKPSTLPRPKSSAATEPSKLRLPPKIGKKKPINLKITRPPMRPPSA